jgi:PhzF family phenazine biosynthesis protein
MGSKLRTRELKLTKGIKMKIYQVDAFTSQPFSGNPAGVCLLDGPAPAGWMQNVAREMNLSETAFLHPEGDGYRLRWFTPAVEVALCGHATLASAHTLYETGRLKADQTARFHTLSGLLTARLSGAEIELDFPATPPAPADAPDGLAEALGVTPLDVAQSRFDYLVEIATLDELRAVEPNFTALRRLPVRGVMVTCAGDGEYDFFSRFFAPNAGINEDPVTGSAHCTLGPYWGARLGKREMLAYQASARSGVLRVRLEGERVILGGQAVTVLHGKLVGEAGL